MRRHNRIVWELAKALRRLGFSVRVEVWVSDLAELHRGSLREARMDLVVHTPMGVYYLDVCCFHPFTGKGARRTHSAGGTLEAQEEAKFDRYRVSDPVTGQRRTRATFVPVAVTSYGKVGAKAEALFLGFEEYAKQHRYGFQGKRHGWLSRVVSSAAVHGAAQGVLDAYAPVSYTHLTLPTKA